MGRWILGLIVAAGLAAFAVPATAQFDSGAPWGADPFAGVEVLSETRDVVHDDVVHYRYRLRMGDGPYDVVQLHRVVREDATGRARARAGGAFLLPGMPQFFETIFMPSSVSAAADPDHAFAIYLAQNGIDVWGMDWGWDFVPSEAQDFGFMEGWGVAKDAGHADKALSIARRVRTLTGLGNGRLHLLGFSYGVYVGYAVAGEETQRPPGRRNVKGLIPVDSNFKVSTETARLNNCELAASIQADLDQGVFHEWLPLNLIGTLAKTAPSDPSPFVPWLTNHQAAVFIGIPGFVTGSVAPLPALAFTDEQVWIDLLVATPVFDPLQAVYDMYAVRCDDDVMAPVSFDDHLSRVSLPIFYVGKNAAHGLYAATLTASTDITEMLVNPPGYPNLAHGDLFVAPVARDLVWFPILQWMIDHKGNAAPF
jgi:hypothetical protein